MKIFKGQIIFRDINLYIRTGLEINRLFRADNQFFNECGNIIIGDDCGVHLFNAEYGLGYVYLKVVFYFQLAGQSFVCQFVFACEVGQFCGQDTAAALNHLAFAHTAGP